MCIFPLIVRGGGANNTGSDGLVFDVVTDEVR